MAGEPVTFALINDVTPGRTWNVRKTGQVRFFHRERRKKVPVPFFSTAAPAGLAAKLGTLVRQLGTSIARSARMKSQRPAATKANKDAVASAEPQPSHSTVIGTMSAPIPPTTLPPVFKTPHAVAQCRPPTPIVAAQ